MSGNGSIHYLVETLKETCTFFESLRQKMKSTALDLVDLSCAHRARYAEALMKLERYHDADVEVSYVKKLLSGKSTRLRDNPEPNELYQFIARLMVAIAMKKPIRDASVLKELLSWVTEVVDYHLERVQTSKDDVVTRDMFVDGDKLVGRLPPYTCNLILEGWSDDGIVIDFCIILLKAHKNSSSAHQIEVVRLLSSALYKKNKKFIPILLDAVIANIKNVIDSKAEKGKSASCESSDLAIACFLRSFYKLESGTILQVHFGK